MEPFQLSRGYRWYGFLFGVIGPVLLWTLGFIANFGEHGDHGPNAWIVGGQAIFVVIEAAALSLWISRTTRGPASELALAIVLVLGALFATAWCALGLFSIIRELEDVSLFGLFFMVIPAPCVVIYGLSAYHAFRNSRQLARRTRAIPDPGWPGSRSAQG